MTIRYANGQKFGAVLLSRTEGTMRVALQGSDDVLELNQINGTWISEECEAVHVTFSWEQQSDVQRVQLEDCLCSHELAAQLIHSLFAGDEMEAAAAPVPVLATALAHHVV